LYNGLAAYENLAQWCGSI